MYIYTYIYIYIHLHIYVIYYYIIYKPPSLIKNLYQKAFNLLVLN